MRLLTNSRKTFEAIIKKARKFGATELILFGSALKSLRGARDIDLACRGVSGWKLFELAASLENDLHVNIDLIPLSPSTRFTQHIEAHGLKLL